MANLKRSWPIPFAVLALCFLAGGRAASQPVQGNRWVNIGPAPILGGQIGATGNTRPMSGRVADVVVNPSDSDHWLIGAAQGGVWETRDAGTTWTPKTDAQASLAMGAIAFAPSNPNIIYAGTGEAVFSADAYAGAGLLRSTDGGTTWQLLATSTFAKTAFSDLKVDPTNSDIVLAAITRGRAGRGGESPPSPPATGILKSTKGGAAWSLKLGGRATDLEVDPTDFNNQYAGIGEIFGSAAANGVYRSTDGGEIWTLISGPWSTMAGGVGRVELAIAPSNPNILYVSIQDAQDMTGHDKGLLGLFRTDNAWDPTPTWIQIPTGATDDGTGVHGYCGWDLAFVGDSDICWYAHEIIVDPTDPNILYAGGVPLWKCTNCGASPTWTEVSKQVSNPANGIHVDQHSMAWVGNRLIVGNDGGVWSTTDGGNTWADHNTNLSITQFFDGSVHPTNPDFALAGSQDNGTEKWTGTDAWQWIVQGDGADNAISSSNPDTHWAVSFQNLGIRRTTNGGAPFIEADSGIDKAGVPFIARFEKCPAQDDVFIAGTNNLWRSNNFFSAVSPSWSSNGPEMGAGITITALAFAASDLTCNTYAFGTSNGQLRLTTKGGAPWNDIDAGNGVPNRYVTDLAFDPTDANILYVTLSGFDEDTPGQPGHVFKTTNALAASPTWSNVTPPENLPHNTIVLDPFDPNTLYVGTDKGVWMSSDGGTKWTHMGPETGMPNVAVFDLQINPDTGRLFAFTHGRGAFVIARSADVTSFTGRGHGVGMGKNTAGVAIVGIFTSTEAIDLSAFPATVTLTSLFNEVGGAGEVVAGLPLTLFADPRNNANVARFKTPVGVLPIAKVTIGAKGGGRFTFRVDVAKATIVPPSCPTTNLTTSFTIDDGFLPVVVTTEQPWLCFGAGNKYLKSPPP